MVLDYGLQRLINLVRPATQLPTGLDRHPICGSRSGGGFPARSLIPAVENSQICRRKFCTFHRQHETINLFLPELAGFTEKFWFCVKEQAIPSETADCISRDTASAYPVQMLGGVKQVLQGHRWR